MKSDRNDTVERILRSAEIVFAAHGYHATSIRDVTEHAKANLAAINYHFGDKEGLYSALISNLLKPMNAERMERLDHAAALAGNRPIPLPLIIDIFASPIFRLSRRDGSKVNHALRLLGRCLIEPLPFLDCVLATEFHPVINRFAQEIRRHLPNLPPDEFMWRLNYVVGAMHHSLANSHRMSELTSGLCKNSEPEKELRQFVHLAVSTLIAVPLAGHRPINDSL